MSSLSALALSPSSCLVVFCFEVPPVNDFHDVKSMKVYLAPSCSMAHQYLITVNHSTGSIFGLGSSTMVSIFFSHLTGHSVSPVLTALIRLKYQMLRHSVQCLVVGSTHFFVECGVHPHSLFRRMLKYG